MTNQKGPRLDARCGEDVFHQMFIDPGIALQPLPADSDDLWPLQKAHLQLKRHGYLPKVTLGPTLEGIPLMKNKGDDQDWIQGRDV